MTDAVDKVGDEQPAGNNRIQVPSFLNRYCAPDSYLDSMLLTRPSKNVYRQHRSIAEAARPHRMGPLLGDERTAFLSNARNDVNDPKAASSTPIAKTRWAKSSKCESI